MRRGLVLLTLLALLGGCTISSGKKTFTLFHLAPGDDVQTQKVTLLGVDVSPTGPEGPRIFLGYSRIEQTRVPGFDEPTMVPSVKSETRFDVQKGIAAEEILWVGDHP